MHSVQRVLSAAVGIPVLLAVVLWSPSRLFAGLVVVLALRAQWELYRMFAAVSVEADRAAGLVLGTLVVLAFAARGGSQSWLVPLALSLAVAGCLALGLRRATDSHRGWNGMALTLLGVCYCAWLLGHVIWLRALPDGRAFTLLGVGVTWCGESAAYFVGRRFGRRKLAPRLSPGKTMEGAAAQVVVSVAAALLASSVLPLSLAHAATIGLMLGVVGQIGDLAESFLKRSAATKDAGAIFPGHGGVLDRLDSLLFNLPALYYYLHFLATR